MNNIFAEYNPINKEDLVDLWKNALIVFDANILLNLYRYSDETSGRFLETIIKLKDRIWLPYQVGLEYNKNRIEVIADQKKHYIDFEKKFSDLLNEIENKNRNPFLSVELADKLIKFKNEITKEVDGKVKKYEDTLLEDKLLNQINAVFDGKVGEAFSEIETKNIYAEGELRYKNKIPPGYQDNKKPEDQKFGDFIIWRQILKQAKDKSKSIIFVLDDRKEDWWFEYQGKTISARPELLKEFRLETGQKCHFYKPFQFLSFSNEFLGNNIEEKIITEVKNHQSDISSDIYKRIDWILQGTFENVQNLIIDMSEAGYDVYIDSISDDEISSVHIILPDIPDLERRFNNKYLFKVSEYALTLLSRKSTALNFTT